VGEDLEEWLAQDCCLGIQVVYSHWILNSFMGSDEPQEEIALVELLAIEELQVE
jgi:hypothetical protein